MSRWETTSTYEGGASPADIWEKAYADANAWPAWNAELKSAKLNGPLGLGATAHLVEPAGNGGSRLTNTIYIEGPLAPLWRRVMGPRAAKTLPGAQKAVIEMSGRGTPG